MDAFGPLQKSGKESQLNLIPDETDMNHHHHHQHHPPSSTGLENQQNFYKDEVAAMGDIARILGALAPPMMSLAMTIRYSPTTGPESKDLEVVQIMVGITTVVFGSFLRSAYVGQTSIMLLSKVTVWAGILFVIGGAVDVFAQKHRQRDHLVVSLFFNVITAIGAVAAVIIYSFDLASRSYEPCYNEGKGVTFNQCKIYRGAYLILQNGTLVLLLVFALLEFCISIAILVFAIQARCGKSSHSETLQPELTTENIYEDPNGPSMQDAGKWPSYGTQWETPDAIPPAKQ